MLSSIQMNLIGKKKLLGIKSEEKAEEFLKNLGYQILFKNFRTNLHHSEIDLIALDCSCLVLIEVRSSRVKNPRLRYSIGSKKQRALLKAAQLLQRTMKLNYKAIRFDFLFIEDNKIDHYKNVNL